MSVVLLALLTVHVEAEVAAKRASAPPHTSEIAAALAYDAAARRHHGAFAALNFPGPGEQSALTRGSAL